LPQDSGRGCARPFPGWHIEDAFTCDSHELLIVLVHDHPTPVNIEFPPQSRPCDPFARYLLGRVLEELRSSANWVAPALLAQEEHIAVQESLLALAIDGAAICGRDEISAVTAISTKRG